MKYVLLYALSKVVTDCLMSAVQCRDATTNGPSHPDLPDGQPTNHELLRRPIPIVHHAVALSLKKCVPNARTQQLTDTFTNRQMENTQDDPRTYQQQPMPGGMEEGYPPGMDHFLRERDPITARTRTR